MYFGLHHAEGIRAQKPANRFDRMMILVGSLGPLSLMPQVFIVWRGGDVSGVSLSSWSLLTIVSLMWILYGIRHRSKALVISNLLATIFNLLIVVGVLAAS